MKSVYITNKKKFNNSILANPLVVFVGIWSFVFYLYYIKLSEQLIFEVENFTGLYLCIVMPYIFGVLLIRLIYLNFSHRLTRMVVFSDIERLKKINDETTILLKKRLRIMAILCVVGEMFEVIVSSGVPIYWYFIANGKQHSDFGIPSIHGFLMSMIVAYATISFYLFKVTLDKLFLLNVGMVLLWCLIIVSRNFFIATCLQLMFISLMLRKFSFSKAFIYFIIIGTLLILLFGAVGDFRTGSDDLILAVGRPTENYPSWLPSGFLWVYIYASTPLNNLMYNFDQYTGDHFIGSLSTFTQLFPSIIRYALFPEGSFTEVQLVDLNLNVSTAFIDPMNDGGILGIVCYSFLMGVIGGLFWLKRARTFFMLGYSFIAQALLLSIFFNHLLYLPYLMQLVWFSFYLKGLNGSVIISGSPLNIRFIRNN